MQFKVVSILQNILVHSHGYLCANLAGKHNTRTIKIFSPYQLRLMPQTASHTSFYMHPWHNTQHMCTSDQSMLVLGFIITRVENIINKLGVNQLCLARFMPTFNLQIIQLDCISVIYVNKKHLPHFIISKLTDVYGKKRGIHHHFFFQFLTHARFKPIKYCQKFTCRSNLSHKISENKS